MLVLAHASCSTGSCHGVWADPLTGDLYVVGDRTSEPTRGELAVTTVRVSLPIYAEATAVLRTASAAGRPGDELPAEVRADAAYVTGHPVMTTPASIQVAAHEAAIIVRRLAPGQLEALHAVGHD